MSKGKQDWPVVMHIVKYLGRLRRGGEIINYWGE